MATTRKPSTTKAAPEYAAYAEKPETALMTDLSQWLLDNTGLEVADRESFNHGVRLATYLRMTHQASDHNKEQTALRRASKAEAIEAAKAEREQARAEKAEAAAAAKAEKDAAKAEAKPATKAPAKKAAPAKKTAGKSNVTPISKPRGKRTPAKAGTGEADF